MSEVNIQAFGRRSVASSEVAAEVLYHRSSLAADCKYWKRCVRQLRERAAGDQGMSATTLPTSTTQQTQASSMDGPVQHIPVGDDHKLRALVRVGLANFDRVSLEQIVSRAYRMGTEGCHRAISEVQSRPQITKLADVEREAVRSAFAAANGDAGRTAEMLGIGRSSVYRKLQKYGLMKPHFDRCPNCGCKLHLPTQQ
jgi:DNA-binding NtrC family response regulator